MILNSELLLVCLNIKTKQVASGRWQATGCRWQVVGGMQQMTIFRWQVEVKSF